MNLLSYINQTPKDVRPGFASRCETTIGYLLQVAYGNKTCGEKLAINIDRESSGAVTCEMLRPDVDWKHLRESKKPKKV